MDGAAAVVENGLNITGLIGFDLSPQLHQTLSHYSHFSTRSSTFPPVSTALLLSFLLYVGCLSVLLADYRSFSPLIFFSQLVTIRT